MRCRDTKHCHEVRWWQIDVGFWWKEWETSASSLRRFVSSFSPPTASMINLMISKGRMGDIVDFWVELYDRWKTYDFLWDNLNPDSVLSSFDQQLIWRIVLVLQPGLALNSEAVRLNTPFGYVTTGKQLVDEIIILHLSSKDIRSEESRISHLTHNENINRWTRKVYP